MSRRRAPEPTPSRREGRGEPLLLIHPFTLDHEVWAEVLPQLTDRFDVVAATLPGHRGGKHLPASQVSVAAFADGLEELLDDLGWDTCHVAGNSIGGALSLELARRGRARSVTAIAPAGGWTRFSFSQLLVGSKFLALTPALYLGRVLGESAGRLPRRLLRPLLRVVSHHPDEVPPEVVASFVRATTHCSAFLPYIWSDLRLGCMNDVASLDVPVQLVLCEEDWLLPPERYGRFFREQLPDADLVELSDVGHVPMYDDPHGIAELIASHAAAHSGLAGGALAG